MSALMHNTCGVRTNNTRVAITDYVYRKDLKFMRILSKIRALQQCSFANSLAVAILALSLPLLISCGGLSEDQEELLQADPCVQDLLNGIPRTFRTEGGFFTRSRTEAYAGDLFFLIAYGKRIPSGVYVSPGFLTAYMLSSKIQNGKNLHGYLTTEGLRRRTEHAMQENW